MGGVFNDFNSREDHVLIYHPTPSKVIVLKQVIQVILYFLFRWKINQCFGEVARTIMGFFQITIYERIVHVRIFTSQYVLIFLNL